MAIRLLIDKQEVHLSAETNAIFVSKNPFFTKQGEHTMDIDIDLHDPQNALVYQNIHRIDVDSIPSNRDAIMTDERGLILHGTEIILQINNDSAKIQIVAGNSELNYLAGTRSKIRQLYLGKVVNLTGSSFADFMRSTWTDENADCVFSPFCYYNPSKYEPYQFSGFHEWNDEDKKQYYLKPFVSSDITINFTETGQGFPYATGITMETDNAFPMPYLHAIVRMFIESLGYTVGKNAIAEDDLLKKIVIVQRSNFEYYSLMLPDWTISEFIDEVEKFCNVLFDIDQESKVVNVCKVNEFYQDYHITSIKSSDIYSKVNKDYSETDAKLPYNYVNNNISYDFPDADNDEFYKYASIGQDLINACRIEEVTPKIWSNTYYTKQYADLFKAITNSEDFLNATSVPSTITTAMNTLKFYKLKIFTEDNWYVFRKAEDDLVDVSIVNQFGQRFLNEDADETKLKIVPVQEMSSHLYFDHSTSNNKALQFPMPYLPWPKIEYVGTYNTQPSTSDSSSQEGINKYITSGYEGEDNQEPDAMFVGIFFGLKKVTWEDPTINAEQDSIQMPIVAATNEVQLRHERVTAITDLVWKDGRLADLGNPSYTLAINGERGMFKTRYSKNPSVDLKQKIKIKFKCLKRYDPRDIFIIGNKKYYCQELKYQFDDNKVSEICEGTFYPIGINNIGGKTTYSVYINATNIEITSGYDEQVVEGNSWYCYLRQDRRYRYNAGWSLHVKVQMAGVDVTDDVWHDETEQIQLTYDRKGYISIPSVNGDVIITAYIGY